MSSTSNLYAVASSRLMDRWDAGGFGNLPPASPAFADHNRRQLADEIEDGRYFLGDLIFPVL
jgi:hypothetical protein